MQTNVYVYIYSAYVIDKNLGFPRSDAHLRTASWSTLLFWCSSLEVGGLTGRCPWHRPEQVTLFCCPKNLHPPSKQNIDMFHRFACPPEYCRRLVHLRWLPLQPGIGGGEAEAHDIGRTSSKNIFVPNPNNIFMYVYSAYVIDKNLGFPRSACPPPHRQWVFLSWLLLSQQQGHPGSVWEAGAHDIGQDRLLVSVVQKEAFIPPSKTIFWYICIDSAYIVDKNQELWFSQICMPTLASPVRLSFLFAAFAAAALSWKWVERQLHMT